MKNIVNPHDRYFRAAMSEPQVARDFFEAYLPQEIKKLIDLKSLRFCKESYIDEKLQLQVTDLLFSADFTGQLGYLYLLIEHQSTIDHFMPLRLWKYSLAIMEQHAVKFKEKNLPLVYPMIYYNGQTVYGCSTSFFDLFGAYKDFAKSILLQPFQLIDLTKIADEELRQHTWIGIMGLVMKHIFARNIVPYVETIMPLLREVEKMGAYRYIETTFSYLLQTIEAPEKRIVDIFVKELSSQTGGKLMTIADWLKKEGIDQGLMQKGQQVAIKLLRMGMDSNQVAQITELSLTKINALKQEIESTSID